MSSYYASSTHGRIPMSGRGRQLFQALRNTIAAAINARNWGYNDHALSKARGDLALYVSELEKLRDTATADQTQAPQTSARSINELRHAVAALVYEYARSHVNGRDDVIGMLNLRGARCVRDLDYAGLLELERQLTENTVSARPRMIYAMTHGFTIPDNWFKSPKEKTTMNEETPKKRSDLLSLANAELYQAQKALESLDTVRTMPAPSAITTSAPGSVTLNSGISALVCERWEEMRDEVIYRAEVRVCEAENAVAALLGVERDAPKPRKPRPKKPGTLVRG